MTTMAVWANSDTRPEHYVSLNPIMDWCTVVGGDAWAHAIGKLRRWAADPSALRDQDVEEPALATIQLAMAFSQEARARRLVPPTRVMLNREGGIFFEWGVGATRRLWEIHDEKMVEISCYIDGRCASRKVFDLAGLGI